MSLVTFQCWDLENAVNFLICRLHCVHCRKRENLESLQIPTATMDIVWFLVLIVFYNGVSSYAIDMNASTRPDVVSIGYIFASNSDIGKVSRVAIEAAVEDVNSNPDILGGTKLKLTMLDNNDSSFLGIVKALQFMETDTVAIIGPQSSVTTHVISHITNELQVPLLSFAATDPTLSSLQFPFFVMTTTNDLFQMAAIAEIINYYDWRKVNAIYIDDDFGRNGIVALGDALAEKRCKISYKVALNLEVSRDDITKALLKTALTESRIFVIHAYATLGLMIFDVAHYLGMMGSGYVWIASSWLSTVSDTNSPLPPKTLASIEGVITLRIHIPDSQLKRNFISRWSDLTSGRTANGAIGLNIYGSYAYDTVWLLTHAVDAFFNQGGNISFSNDLRLNELNGGKLNLDAMSIFNGGNLLLHSILHVNMNGVTGPVKFTSDGNRIRPAYEVLNVNGTGLRRVGYWSNYSGLSVMPPEMLYTKPPNRSSSNQQLYDVIWPGQTTKRPRGWVFPDNGRCLIIGVPNRVSYQEIVSHVKGTDMFAGYCIDVFTAALNLLPYAVPYKLVPFGDGLKNPITTELVSLINMGVYDAAIGDIAIITSRTKMADFTHPFIESGLVVVAPVRRLNSNALTVLKPFTPQLWCTTAISFLSLGVVIWVLEHRMNDEFRGPPGKQVVTVLWFSISTLFGTQRENTVSSLGRGVLVIWLFVVLIINSSYTASLTSILTVQQLSSPIEGIDTLISSNDPIGYQLGSFAKNYLMEQLNIDKARLVPLNSPEDYEKALTNGPNNGGVAALVDERAYMELFLSTRCKFSIVGQAFTKIGWGFAFPRDSPLTVDMSTALLQLSENGELERIRNRWLIRTACHSEGNTIEGGQLQLESFSGLFAVCGLAWFLALLVYFMQIMCQFNRYYREESDSSWRSSSSTILQTFLSFVSKKEEVKTLSRRRQPRSASNRSNYGESMNSSMRSE